MGYGKKRFFLTCNRYKLWANPARPDLARFRVAQFIRFWRIISQTDENIRFFKLYTLGTIPSKLLFLSVCMSVCMCICMWCFGWKDILYLNFVKKKFNFDARNVLYNTPFFSLFFYGILSRFWAFLTDSFQI